MATDTNALLLQLADESHLVVCSALKTLAGSDDPGAAVVDSVFELLASPVIAVERTALDTLARFGGRARHLHGRLLARLHGRMQDGKGCDYSCCGYAAYHAPVERYLATLLAIAGRDRVEAALTANAWGLDPASIDEMRFLVGELGADCAQPTVDGDVPQ